jgi:hypothetical protein
LYVCCYLLDEFFFYFFVFSLPTSHNFISFSLVFSLLLIFNLILALTKKRSDFMSAPHLLLKSQTFVQWLLLTNVWSMWLHILLSDDLQVTLWMSLWWYHAPVTAKSLPSAKLIIHFPYHLFRCEDCALHMLDINRTLCNLTLKSRNTLSTSELGNASHTFSKQL